MSSVWSVIMCVVVGLVVYGLFARLVGPYLGRLLLDSLVAQAGKIMMTDTYNENLLELYSAVRRFGFQEIAELNLRAQTGEMIARPLGPPKRMPDFDSLMFDFAQLHRLPTAIETPVDVKVTIGKKAHKPLILDLPMIVGGMAYGEALSEAAKVALAKGATQAGTATNTGEGPFLQSERDAAKYLILQYNRGDWSKQEDILHQADAIEIQLGQAAFGGVGHVFPAGKIDATLREAFSYPPGKDAVTHSLQPEVDDPRKLKDLVARLRKITDGVPIGVKIACGKHLERDLEWCIRADVDFISASSAQAASRGSPPILQDDFGVPNVYAVHRAARYLQKRRVRDRITLLVGGRIRTPGEVLKAIALGADACYVGAAALFAVSHTQSLKPIPFEPPTQLVWYDGKFADKLDVDKAAQSLCKFLESCRLEIEAGVRALGKCSIHEVDRDDLMCLDETMAKGLEIPMAYEPQK